MEREELSLWLRLVLTPGFGNHLTRKLLAAFGPPEAILAQPASVLERLVGPSLADALVVPQHDWEAQTALTSRWLESTLQDGIARQVVTLGDSDYPASLLQTEDPPVMLYLMGQLPWPSTARCLAIVGSRNPTPQGITNAQQFARALAQQDWVVISGLALGIDGAAHEGALQAASSGVATVAVVGTGLDRVYPARHRDLARRIAERGLLMSEYHLGTPPLPANFPKRNRLIAGLSEGTLVVEAAMQSGSLITARLATEMGREVFAIPGSIHSTQSRGCHELIKQGAKLVESAQDVLEELDPGMTRTPPDSTSPMPDPETDLLQHLGYDPVSLDVLQARTGLPTSQLQAELLELELQGLVGRLPGGLFQRLSSA